MHAVESVKDQNSQEPLLKREVAQVNDTERMKKELQEYGVGTSGLSKSVIKRLYRYLVTYLEAG